MPKLPPFALADARPARKRPQYLIVFWLLFAIPLFLIHIGLLDLPYFWDELGQFVPTALDLLRTGSLIPHSTVPNVHPPGVEAYLAILYKVFGYSIPLTRVAMLLVASTGLLVTFLLAIELSPGTKGAPAFLPPLLLLVSPLFYTQSMMAQLDMPAMVLTILALLLFLKRRYAWAAAAGVALVLVKETGIVVPLVFFIALLRRKNWRHASYFVAPAIALSAWLLVPAPQDRLLARRSRVRALQRRIRAASRAHVALVHSAHLLSLLRRVPLDRYARHLFHSVSLPALSTPPLEDRGQCRRRESRARLCLRRRGA